MPLEAVAVHDLSLSKMSAVGLLKFSIPRTNVGSGFRVPARARVSGFGVGS